MELRKQTREIRYFFYSQAFADGFRTTFAILLPALLGLYFDFFATGLTVSLGAMGVSLTDAPGPVIHRMNGMRITAVLAFIVSLLTFFARLHPLTMGLEIVLVTFFFSMFTVYGNRATSVGNVAIMMMILTMDKPVPAGEEWIQALLIFGGGLLYMVISLLLYTIRPYRIAERALADCIREIATYLSIRGDFYRLDTDLESDYRHMVAQQIVVHEKQDQVRELLFKTRQIVRESTAPGRKLLFTFVETVDLFEDITASYSDYSLLRRQFGPSGLLDEIAATLKKMARELDSIGIAIQTQQSFSPTMDYDQELRDLKNTIDRRAAETGVNTAVLKRILVNLRKVLTGFRDIRRYFEADMEKGRVSLDHSHFVSHQSLDAKLMRDNLTLRSSVFRHALRVSLACVSGYLIAQVSGYGQHSYWILLTIAFIVKPAFSLTKQRNIERMIGTVAGGAVGIALLVFVPNKTAQFLIMVVLMIGSYSFMRLNYLLMVLCLTPYILILFSFLGYGFRDVVTERVLDTVIGGALAFFYSYFLFPNWESEGMKEYMKFMVRANGNYLKKVIEALSGEKVGMLEYKLARRDVYLHSANLSAAFQRMISEPRSKQWSEKQVHQFVVLNHILFSNIASIATALLATERKSYHKDLLQLAKRAYEHLQQSRKNLGDETPDATPEKLRTGLPPEEKDEQLLKDQLQFIYKLSTDIEKTSSAVLRQAAES